MRKGSCAVWTDTALLPASTLSILQIALKPGPAGLLPSTCCRPCPCSLALLFPAFTAANPLPPVQHGAVPQLVDFSIILIGQTWPIPLPASWGLPGIWPSLRFLQLTAAIALPLPSEWAHGFPALEKLFLDSNTDRRLKDVGSKADRSPAAPIPDGPMHPLPAEWARGFPKLQSITLAYLGLNGTFPATWQARGSFPELQEL